MALVVGDQRASELVGIPRRTVAAWRKDPRLEYLRDVAQDQLARSMWQGVVVALAATVEGLHDPKAPLRDRAIALGILSDKALLLTGMATSRHEAVGKGDDADPTAGMTAEEKRDLKRWIDQIEQARDEELNDPTNPLRVGPGGVEEAEDVG